MCKKVNSKKIIIAGLVVWVVGTLMGVLTCGWLFNWVYTIPPNIWKDADAMMSVNNMIGANVVGFISALIFVYVYAILYNGIPGEGAQKGMKYGFLVWLVGNLLGIVSMPFYMTIANTVVIYWIIQSLIVNLINGAIIGSMYKEKEK